MSALGHKPTYAMQTVMSALPPEADMCSAIRNVRYGPTADIREYRSQMSLNGSGLLPVQRKIHRRADCYVEF
jgi:hypothetical protein